MKNIVGNGLGGVVDDAFGKGHHGGKLRGFAVALLNGFQQLAAPVRPFGALETKAIEGVY